MPAAPARPIASAPVAAGAPAVDEEDDWPVAEALDELALALAEEELAAAEAEELAADALEADAEVAEATAEVIEADAALAEDAFSAETELSSGLNSEAIDVAKAPRTDPVSVATS